MRKINAFFCMILMGFGVNTMAQENTVTLPHISSGPGSVTIPVAYDFTTYDVCAFEIAITFDTNELTYVDYNEGDIPDDADFQVNEAPAGTINIAWAKVGAIDNAGILVNLDFDYTGTGGSTDLEFTVTGFIPGHPFPGGDPSWLADCTPEVVTTTFTDGSITYQSAAVPLSSWALVLGMVLMATFVAVRFLRVW